MLYVTDGIPKGNYRFSTARKIDWTALGRFRVNLDVLIPHNLIGEVRSVSPDVSGHLTQGPYSKLGDSEVWNRQLHGELASPLIGAPPENGNLTWFGNDYGGGAYRRLVSLHCPYGKLFPGSSWSLVELANKKADWSGDEWSTTSTGSSVCFQADTATYPIVIYSELRIEEDITGDFIGGRKSFVSNLSCHYFGMYRNGNPRLSSADVGEFLTREERYGAYDSPFELCELLRRRIQESFGTGAKNDLRPRLLKRSVDPSTKISSEEFELESRRLEDSFIIDLRHHLGRLTSCCYRDANADAHWGEVCLEAIQNAKYVSINTFAYLVELKDTFSEVKAIKDVMAKPLSMKAWASLYLGTKYGTRLTVADTLELFNGAKRAHAAKDFLQSRGYNTCRSRKTYTLTPVTNNRSGSHRFQEARLDYYYKVYHVPVDSALLRGIKRLMDWDVWLLTKNSWDLVPYSFVINWFVDLESFFEQFDAHVYAEYLDVIQILKSTKLDVDYSDYVQTFAPFRGIVECNRLQLSDYQRDVGSDLSLPAPAVSGDQTWYNHLPELGAIIVQRRG